MNDLTAARAGVECSHSLAQSLDRRRRVELARRARLRARAISLPFAAVGIYLVGSQLLKTEGLPVWPLLIVGAFLLVPFLATFGME